ncbi:MAG: hypothetical protein GF331_01460 [Chitinivibrionales bacterium]|nr:hypothetical protein [Chitinivibrionales bacterium]
MTRNWSSLAMLAAVLLHTCADDTDTITSADPGPLPADPNGVVWNIEYGKLTGYDLARDSVVAEDAGFRESFDARSMVAEGDMLYIGLKDGVLLPVDVSDHTQLLYKPQVQVPADVNGALDELSLHADALWAIEQSLSMGVRLVRFAADDGRLIDTLRLGTAGRNAYGLTVYSGDPWVLVGNPFMLLRIDARTCSVVDTVALGRDPANAAVRGFFDGAGRLARAGAAAWVADNTSRTLLEIDLGTAAVVRELDIGSLLAGSEMQLLASDWGVFLTDGISAAETMYKLDPANGSVIASYTVGVNEGIFHSTIKQQRLLINLGGPNGMNNIVELDTETMTTLHETGFDIYSLVMAIQ